MTPKKPADQLLKRGRKPKNTSESAPTPISTSPKPEVTTMQNPAVSSGGRLFEIEQHQINLDKPVVDASGKTVEKKPEKKEISATQLLVNAAMIRTVIMGINKTVVAMTSNPKLAFDDDETDKLTELWSPFMPEISPLAMAITGTVIIVGGKVGVYMIDKKKEKKGEKNQPEKKDFTPEKIVSQENK